MQTASDMVFEALKIKKQQDKGETKNKIERLQSVLGDWQSSKMELRKDTASKHPA